MNKTILIWRIIAILILLIFAILMWNLYADLSTLQRQRSEGAVQSGAVIADGRGAGLRRGGLRGAGPSLRSAGALITDCGSGTVRQLSFG